MGRQLTPPFHGAAVFSVALHVPRQLLERLRTSFGQPGALHARPALELRRAAYMKAIEERSTMQRGNSFQISLLHGRFEFRNIATDDGGVEAQVCPRSEGLVGIQSATHVIKRLTQRLARTLGIGIRPEGSQHPLAAHPTIASAGDHDRNGKKTTLRCRTGQRRAIPLESHATKSSQIEHLALSEIHLMEL